MAQCLAERAEYEVTVSLAGRTSLPLAQAVPVRVGGFGGIVGLVGYLGRERIDAIVDATHPYADTMSRNAALASETANIPLIALRRPPWKQVAGDLWSEMASTRDAVACLGVVPRRVFLALGRQEVRAFEAAPQHTYLVRSVDPLVPPLAVPRAEHRLGRGPFLEEAEREMLVNHCTEVIVSKNSGGTATYGKIAAARELGLKVLLLRRPELPVVPEVPRPEAVLPWLDHVLALRGV